MRFYVIGIDPSRSFYAGYGFWRDEDGRVFKDAVAVADREDDAYFIAKDNGQICYLAVETESDLPNGFLVKAESADLDRLFTQEVINGYTRFYGEPLGLPTCFTVVDEETFKRLPERFQAKAQPVFFEFVYV